MDKQAQRIAIAEFCGWDMHPDHCKTWQSKDQWCSSPSGEIKSRYNIPDYDSDLNAISEAEKLLYSPDNSESPSRLNYFDYLKRVCGPSMCCDTHDMLLLITAPAAQRAEALLRTIGKWVD